ncbi:MAG: hypothetical protein CSB47_03350 [Proteobacteria bacterium]|nr:MAG: hypothetical protein CSB47_03350 [Pseudomonadota bacterium]
MTRSTFILCLVALGSLGPLPLVAETKTSANGNTTTVLTETTRKVADQAAVALPKATSTRLLKALGQRVIVPLYQRADKTATALNQQVIHFCNNPTEANLQSVRRHWSHALSAWESSEIALFGPALRKQRDLHIYFRPVKKRVIKKLLRQETPISIDNLEFAGVGAQGFASMEYLLFDREKSDADIVAQFAADDSRHCQHLLAISTLLKRDIAAILHEWNEGYVTALTQTGGDTTAFANDTQALEMVYGKIDQLSEAIINKLRHALAKNAQLAGKDPKRENTNAYKLEAWRSGHTLANIHANLYGIDLALAKSGIFSWLEQSGNGDLVKQYQSIREAINKIDFPSDDLFQQIEDKQLEAGDALFDQVRALSKVVQAIAAKLGIQLGFNDSDGD